jgi:AhpD family alkylhydroperoxidase
MNLKYRNEKSRLLIESLYKQNGFSLNIFEDMSASPLPIRVYNQAQALVYQEAILSKIEINLVQLAVSVENECHFCVPAHTCSALKRDRVDKRIVDAIRNGHPITDSRINELVNISKLMVRHRGKLPTQEIENFLSQGYSHEHLFEILTIVAYKTITNYTSQLMGTKPNEEHIEFLWKK